MESINNLDESKVIGYFESLKGNFLLKIVLMVTHSRSDPGRTFIDNSKIPESVIHSTKEAFDFPIFFKALKRGNEELYLNFLEDIVTSLFTSSWIIFEQITKDLTNTNYSLSVETLSVCYTNNKFQFTKREKKDIELFYYIRNSISHHNGAYFASKEINRVYSGHRFLSKGNEGKKITLSLPLVWKMANDLEKLTLKAWANTKNMP